MTISGWIVTVVLVVVFIFFGVGGLAVCESVTGKALSIIFAVILSICVIAGGLWYYNGTASGRRALTDQKSELRGGLERTITVYTADGQVIATYTGKIDIEGNDGGYVLFDFEGKRYTYYNCFVESIADIR